MIEHNAIHHNNSIICREHLDLPGPSWATKAWLDYLLNKIINIKLRTLVK